MTLCADVQKRYKKLALQLHPDKVGDDPVHVDKFQAATTAYQVLSNEGAQEAYWHMYRMRCYLFQVAHAPQQQLAPFYCFRVKKRDAQGSMQDRLLTADLREECLQNWKKDKPHKRHELKHLKAVTQTGDLTFSVIWKNGARDYRLAAESADCCRVYVSVLQAIAARQSWMSDDDAHFPPPSAKKGYVEKRGRSGEWARRWLLLGSSGLLIFRNQDCVELVNTVPLDAATCSASKVPDSIEWTVSTGARKYVFRNSKPSLANSWVEAVKVALEPGQRSWLAPKEEGAEAPASKGLVFNVDDIDEALSGAGEHRMLLDMALETAPDDAGTSGDDDHGSDDERSPVHADDASSNPSKARNGGVIGFIRRRLTADGRSSAVGKRTSAAGRLSTVEVKEGGGQAAAPSEAAGETEDARHAAPGAAEPASGAAPAGAEAHAATRMPPDAPPLEAMHEEDQPSPLPASVGGDASQPGRRQPSPSPPATEGYDRRSMSVQDAIGESRMAQPIQVHGLSRRASAHNDGRPPVRHADLARLAAQREAHERAEAELRGVSADAKKPAGELEIGRSPGEGLKSPANSKEATAKARALEAERVGRAVANHLGQGGMVRHHL